MECVKQDGKRMSESFVNCIPRRRKEWKRSHTNSEQEQVDMSQEIVIRMDLNENLGKEQGHEMDGKYGLGSHSKMCLMVYSEWPSNNQHLVEKTPRDR